MKTHDFKEMGNQRLAVRVREMQRDLRQLREDVQSGKEKNHAQISQLKRDVARALTALHQLKSQSL